MRTTVDDASYSTEPNKLSLGAPYVEPGRGRGPEIGRGAGNAGALFLSVLRKSTESHIDRTAAAGAARDATRRLEIRPGWRVIDHNVSRAI